jgi:hypothetical protein
MYEHCCCCVHVLLENHGNGPTCDLISRNSVWVSLWCVANVGKVLLMYYIEIICIIQKGDYKHYNPPHEIIII